MRRLTYAGIAVALLFSAAPSDAAAQASQWRITPFIGGSIIGEAGNSDAGETTEFSNGFSFGLSTMYRKGRWGIELLGQFTPTEATSAIAFAESSLGDDHPHQPDPVFVSYLNDQFLMSGTLNFAVFSSDRSWNEERPLFDAREWYVVGGAGLMYFSSAHPARDGIEFPEGECGDVLTLRCDSEYQGWDAGQLELTFNFGVGVQFNILPDLSIQLDFRDHLFRAVERNASRNTIAEQPVNDPANDEIIKRWQNHFVFRQGVTFLWF